MMTPVSAKKRPRILILNAALSGAAGNTAVALRRLRKALARKAEVRVVTLAGAVPGEVDARADAEGVASGVDAAGAKRVKGFAEVKAELAWAEGFVFGTGTHWDSWSSVLQGFLEDATEAEGTALWLGKPVACVVTEHSVGGKGVLSRLQGVLVTMGCAVPPMSGVVLSKVAQMAAGRGAGEGRGLANAAKRAKGAEDVKLKTAVLAGTEDFWSEEDLKIVAHNLVEAVTGTRRWKAWRVDREEFSARWMVGEEG